ncbi:hypothetical protein IU470_22150 [Nocardia abscessus]|uniref:Oxidoreductase n=1 Tax=Nocardia abscessus TaxID=120957 RepID=A0ABS0CBQ1_9NOCA|nr:hypothetical protein [Nocardia abscessus]MBF6227799.1 hypothetical protein [Nocardia abscessus]
MPAVRAAWIAANAMISRSAGRVAQYEQQRAGLEQWRTAIKILEPGDIGAAIAYAVAVPQHVNIAELVVVPTQQG